MKKLFKKTESIIFALTILFGTVLFARFVGIEFPNSNLFGMKAEAATYSGTCGDNLTWSFDIVTGELVIIGTGDMIDLDSHLVTHWKSYNSQINTIVINDGVRSIGDYAFRNCTSLTSVSIPDSVTSIGNYAFEECRNLISVTIGNGVTSIGKCAFYECYSLTNITIPDSVVSIGNNAFTHCESLTSVTIPDSVTSIGDCAFIHCYELNSITVDASNQYYSSDESGVLFNKNKTELIQYPVGNERTEYIIPDSVTSIGYSAFDGCTGLTSVTIPDSVTSIGNYAFDSCKSLTNVTIGNSVTSIGISAFSICPELKSVYYSGDIADWCSIGFFDSESNPMYYANNLYINGKKIEGDLDLPVSVTSIGDYAFYGCHSLTSVTIPDSVTSIGNYAFDDCIYLTSVTIGNGVTSIGKCAFHECYRLTSVTIGNSVTSIGEYAFYFCAGLTSVTIPDSVTSIGEYAFYGCHRLTSVTIGNSVTSIGNYAFANCRSLTELTMPVSAEIYDSPCTFKDCVNIKKIILTKGTGNMKQYGSSSEEYTCYLYTPWYISGCNSIIIEDGVKTIGDYAFYGCNGLTSITIPNSVTSIGECAFGRCTGLASLTLGNSVTSIGDNAFNNCTGLTSVSIPDSVIDIGNYAFRNCTGLTSVTIGDNVTSIGKYAFSECCNLTSVTIPDSVTSIDSDAFYNCTGLTSITIGNGVTSIGNNAFYGCTGLTSVTIPDSVIDIGNYAFEECRNLISVTIGNGVTSIGKCAFYNCTGLTSVTIGDNVTSIGEYAFYFCTGLTSVTIGNSVTTIGDDAFSECCNLTIVTIPDSVTTIGDDAFYKCSGLKSVTIGNGVTSIGDEAFFFCNELSTTYYAGTPEQWSDISIGSYNDSLSRDIIFECNSERPYYKGTHGNNITWMLYTDGELVIDGTGKMANCSPELAPWYTKRSLINTVTIGNRVTSIGNYAFYGCTGLTSFTIPDSITSIGNHAFENCTGLTSVTIPDSVTSIGYEAFYGCTGLTSVYYTGDIAGWCSINFGDSWSNPMRYADSLYINGKIIEGDLVIPDIVTSIGNYAFYNCTGLTSVTIPNSVTSIGNSAFFGCTGLTSVIIPDSVTSIGEDAFCGCTGLTSVTIPDSVTSIGNSAFFGCTGLTSVTISNSVTSIGAHVFYNCTGLTSVTIPNSVTSIGEDAFCGCTGLTSVIIPDSVTRIGFESFNNTGIYNDLSNWENDVLYIGNHLITARATISGDYNIKNGTKVVADRAFFKCEGLTSVTIPDSVVSIGNDAFCDCYGLTSVTIGNSVTSIGEYAFYFCTGLTSVTIGNSVTSIGNSAFYGCELTVTRYPGSQEQWNNISIRSNNSRLTKNIIFDCNSEKPYYTSGSCGENLFYTVYADGKLAITGSGDMMDYPSSSDAPWFVYRGEITSVSLSGEITSIGDYAFNECDELVEFSYDGTAEEWETVSIGIGNDNLIALKVGFSEYKVSWTYNNETYNEYVKVGNELTPPSMSEKAGYTFVGWTPEIPETMPAKDMSFTAVFKANSYNAVFNANGGTWSDGATTKTVATDFDREIIAPENPSKQGYDFAGWDSEIGIMDDVNGKIFSAKWTARNDTVYTVETYTMDIYGKYSVVKETKNGTTDTEATVTANAQPGFTFNNAKSKLSGNVAADGSLVLKVFYDRNTYTFTTVVEGKTTSNSYYFDAPVTMPANPYKPGYKFIGWDKTIPSKMPANDVTVTAKFELSFKMSIRNPSTTTIKYGDKIILHADMNEALPSGWTVKWTADNGNFSYSVSADGSTCTISPNKSGSTNFKATVYDEKGNVFCEDTQSMTSKAGFFDKIGAFFRKLFGSTKTIPQLFKGIF